MIDSLVTAFRAPDIRRKILFTLGILLIFRMLTNVPVPGVDQEKLASLFNSNQLLGLLDLFSGGGLATASIIGMGVNPYINASIIMQLMQGVIPSLGELAREGEYGRNRLNQYTRLLTVPMAFAQGYGFSVLLSSNGVIPPRPLFSFETFSLLLSFTAGTILLMWLGELISERGLGNGISFIIFAGIVGRIPHQAAADRHRPGWLHAHHPVHHHRDHRHRRRGLHQRGPAPDPGAVRQPGPRAAHVPGPDPVPAAEGDDGRRDPDHLRDQHPAVPGADRPVFHRQQHRLGQGRRDFVVNNLSPSNPLVYGVLYFVLVVFFTYFYTAFQFRPDQTADYLRKNGGFIPGIRPGKPTEEFLGASPTASPWAARCSWRPWRSCRWWSRSSSPAPTRCSSAAPAS